MKKLILFLAVALGVFLLWQRSRRKEDDLSIHLYDTANRDKIGKIKAGAADAFRPAVAMLASLPLTDATFDPFVTAGQSPISGSTRTEYYPRTSLFKHPAMIQN